MHITRFWVYLVVYPNKKRGSKAKLIRIGPDLIFSNLEIVNTLSLSNKAIREASKNNYDKD
jgi:hypothetical protein